MFAAHKLYLDLVSDDGSVVIAYLTAVNALGLRLSPAGIERYAPSGERTALRGQASVIVREEPATAQLACVDFTLEGARYRLQTELVQGGLEADCAPPEGFGWHVKLARTHAWLTRLDEVGSAVQPELQGTGYADWVALRSLPRRLGLRSLRWGRLHLSGGTVVYTEALRRDGAPFRSAHLWPMHGPPRTCPTWQLSADGAGERQLLRLGEGSQRFEAELLPERVLHQGAATDDARFPARLEQLFFRAIAGPVSERRWLSRARSSSLGDGWAIHESVCFSAQGDAP